jgi:hypothetical protein
MGQRLHQPQPITCEARSSRRHRAADIAHSGLDAAGDDRRGIEQGAVPVEGDQIKGALASRPRAAAGESIGCEMDMVEEKCQRGWQCGLQLDPLTAVRVAEL